jgi:hypothetical protein
VKELTEEELERIQILTIKYNNQAKLQGKEQVTVDQQLKALKEGGKFSATGTADDFRFVVELSARLQS